MANTIHVDVVSAEENIFSGEAEFVALPGEAGELGIYPRHTPLITRIKPGAVRIKVPGQAQDEYVLDKLLSDARAPVEVFGFHCQQACEKLLKAALVCHGVSYPRTHRLAELIDLRPMRGVLEKGRPSMLDGFWRDIRFGFWRSWPRSVGWGRDIF